MTDQIISPYSGQPIPEWSAERVACPRCDAGVGMPCFTGPNSVHTFAVRAHIARKRAAAALDAV